MGELLVLVKSGVEAGKTEDEILDEVADKLPEASAEDVEKALTAAIKAHQLKKGIAEKRAAENLEARIAERAEAAAKSIAEESVKRALELLPNSSNPFSKSGAEVQFKSWLADAVVTKDCSWKPKFKQMLLAARTKNYDEARKHSSDFLEQSRLVSDSEKALLRGDATTGSYAVPDEFSDMVFFVAQRGSSIFDGATKINMSSDLMYLLSSGDVDFTEVADQTTALTESEPTFAQGSLPLADAGAFSLVHDNLLADSNVDITGVMAAAYGRGLLKYLKRATAVGNVATTGDKLNGIYSTSGIGSVAVADAGGAISYDDIVNLIGGIDEVFLDGAVFELNRRELLKIMKLKDSQGQPIFVDAKTKGEPQYILGYPVRLNNQIPLTLNSSTGARTGGTESTILFGTPSEVQIGFKGGFVLDMSEHFKFTNRQATFRGYIRWAMAVMNTSAWARLTNVK